MILDQGYYHLARGIDLRVAVYIREQRTTCFFIFTCAMTQSRHCCILHNTNYYLRIYKSIKTMSMSLRIYKKQLADIKYIQIFIMHVDLGSTPASSSLISKSSDKSY